VTEVLLKEEKEQKGKEGKDSHMGGARGNQSKPKGLVFPLNIQQFKMNCKNIYLR
jgi:hypothetical protein